MSCHTYIQHYLIVPIDSDAFTTEWYDYENHYADGMKVYDLHLLKYTNDGKTWLEIKQDSL